MIGLYVLLQTFGQKHKHRICVHVGTGKVWRLLRVPTIYVLNNNKKKISHFFICKLSIFKVEKIAVYIKGLLTEWIPRVNCVRYPEPVAIHMAHSENTYKDGV